MKKIFTLVLAFSLPLVFLINTPASATNGIWTQTVSGGDWGDGGNWSGGNIAEAGGSADFSTIDITADNTVHFDAPRIIGSLTFGDTVVGTAASWIIDNDGVAGNIMTLSSGGPTSTITVGSLGAGKSVTISAVISSGSNTIDKAGSGTLILSGTNTHTGATTVSAGVLNIQNASALGTTAAGTSVTSGAALQIQGGITTTAEALTLNGTGVAADGALRNISGTNTYAGLVTLGSAARINSDAGTLTLNNTGTITGDTFALTVGGAGNTSIASIIGTGSGTLTKDGTGTLTLSGANTYTGATTVSAGVLNIQNANALGTTVAGTTVADGAALQIQGGITTAAEALTLNGTGVAADGALRNISGTNTYAGLVTLGSAARINSDAGTLTLSNTGTITGDTFALTVGGAGNTSIASIIGTGSGTLTKDGAGTLTLSGANTYTGATTVSAGVLNIRNADALGTTAAGTSVTSGAALQIQGGITTAAEALTLNGTGVADDGALRNISGTNIYAGLITLGSAARINSDAGTVTLSNTGTITGDTFALTVGGAGNTSIASIIGTGSGTLTKDGAGTLTLSGANTYTGVTTVSAGVLNIQNADALGTTAAGTSVTSGAALQIQGGITTAAEALTLNGTGITTTGALRNISGDNDYAGLVTLGSATRINSDSGTLTLSNVGTITGATLGLTVGGAGNTTVESVIGTGTGTLTKDGTGTLTLSAANTYTGLTTVSAGTIEYGINDAISSGAVTVSGGTLDINTYTDTVGAVTLSSGTITGSTGILTGTSYSLTGSGTLSAIISGAGALTKTGSGTATISGANSAWTGGTTISAGTLAVSNASALGTGDVTVQSGGTLDIGTTALAIGTGSTYSQDSGSVLNLTVNGSSTSGSITTDVAAVIDSGSAVSVTVDTSSYISNNTRFTIIDTGGAGIGSAPGTVTSSSTRLRFTLENSGNNLVLIASRAGGGFQGIATTSNSAAVGAVLDGITAPTGDMLTVLNTLENLTDNQAATALNTMVPEVDAGVINITTTSLNTFVGASLERAHYVLNHGSANEATGISTGDEEQKSGLWAKGYGAYLAQDTIDGIAGYDAGTAGTALGVDHLFTDYLTLGISGGYAYGSVDSKVNSANTTINSGQMTLYGGYDGQNYPYYVDVAGSFAWNWYEGKRNVIIGSTISRTAKADYDGQQYGLYLGGGYVFTLQNNLKLIPVASLQWNYLRLGSYTETGASSMDLSVKSQDYNVLQSGVGARIESSVPLKYGILTPEFHGKWLYDFIGDKVQMTSTFTGGGGAFNSYGCKPAQSSFDVGGMLTMEFNNGWAFIGVCDGELKDEFWGVAGSMTARYNF